MAEDWFDRVTISRVDEGEESFVAVKGVLDAGSTQTMRPLIEALVAEERPSVIVDLSQLRVIDSSGVGAIVSLYKRLRAQGGQLTVSGLSAQPLVIFKLLRLERLLVTKSYAPARATFQQSDAMIAATP